MTGCRQSIQSIHQQRIEERLADDYRDINVYEHIITDNLSQKEILTWYTDDRIRDSGRLKVLVILQDHLYMLVWLDEEVTEVLFESIHTSGHRRLSKNTIKALQLQKTPPLHRRFSCGSCPCKRLLFDSLEKLNSYQKGLIDSQGASRYPRPTLDDALKKLEPDDLQC
ncbi:hypothetical protein BDV35DRAFT_141251 [Aspergillus flavus]|uniref:Uncharacterized protein n=1 Tax=Aspergillus flavus TaxID=5059 RepID=A0A5N6GI66_ASPFL|nr:hypothetical protein BDV35DRAFT_141251 [Aspergillus flavus]